MIFTLRLPAGEHQRFAANAFDKALTSGQPITITDPLGGRQEGRLVAAEVIEDGAAAELTLEVDAIPAAWLEGLI